MIALTLMNIIQDSGQKKIRRKPESAEKTSVSGTGKEVPERKLLQVRISPYLWRRVKTASGAECVSIGKFVSTLLEQHVPNVPACYPNPDVPEAA
jgi:predicted HicB family RNase H-like nuclease